MLYEVITQKYIPNDSYDLIIGLGDGGDRLQKISIETIATNRYGHQPIYEFSPFKLELSLPTLDLVDSSNFQISEFMGTVITSYSIHYTKLYEAVAPAVHKRAVQKMIGTWLPL